MDVAGRIRAQLAEGIWPDEIMARLVSEGMSEPNARRIVDKIVAEGGPRPGQTSPEPYAKTHSNGWGQLVSGAFFFSFGTSVTALTYALAKPGGKYLLAYGAIGGGLISIWKGLKEFEPSRGAFPNVAFVVALLLPACGGYGLYAWKRPLTLAEMAARADATEKQQEAEKARAAEEEAARQKREGQKILAEKLNFLQAAVAAQGQTIDGNPAVRCEGARFFKEHKVPDESGSLSRLLESDPELEVRRCALDAMLASGRDDMSVALTLERMEPYPAYRDLVTHGYTRLASGSGPAAGRAAAGLQRIQR